MTIRSLIIRNILTAILTVVSAIPIWSQTIADIRYGEDSLRSARIDSIYQSLNDTASWQREIDFVRNLNFEEIQDVEQVRQTDVQTDDSHHRKRLTWKQQEEQEISRINLNASDWVPEPRLAVWLSLLFPGGGQIYNRKYWKLPIVYGGYVGCIYALTWNQSTYMDYQTAYVDIMDNDPDTRSYEDFLPPHYEIDTSMEEWLKDVFKQRKDKYRRYRDLSIFAFAGMYIIAAIDAYVDAELSQFDISKDLSLRVTPAVINNHSTSNPLESSSFGVNCSLIF